MGVSQYRPEAGPVPGGPTRALQALCRRVPTENGQHPESRRREGGEQGFSLGWGSALHAVCDRNPCTVRFERVSLLSLKPSF